MSDPENIPITSFPEMIFDNSHDAFIISDRNMTILYANSTANRIFGYNDDELKGRCILDLMPEGRKDNYSKDIAEAESGKVVSNADSGEELFGLRRNGEVFPVELTYTRTQFEGRSYFVSQIRDATKKKQQSAELNAITKALHAVTDANRLLTRSEDEIEYLRGICDIITNVGNYSKSLIQYILHNSENKTLIRTMAFSGYHSSRRPVPDMLLSDIISSESPTVIALRTGRSDVCRNIRSSGLWKYWKGSPDEMEFDSTAAVPVISNNEVIAVLRVYSERSFSFGKDELDLLEELARDISFGISFLRKKNDHERALHALDESETKYKALFDSNNDSIVIADAETGIITDANRKSEDIFHTSLDSLIGLNYLKIHPEGYEEKYKNILARLTESIKSVSDEFYIKTLSASGKAIPVKMIADYISIKGKKYIQMIFRDITKEKYEEEKIRDSQKMEALGTLSGGIAHDINNILSPIIGFSQIAIIETENKDKRIECLNEILKAAERAKELVGQILTFSSKKDCEKKPVRIQSIVKEVLRLLSSSVPGNIKVEIDIDQNCGHILCDPIQVYQIIINLCTNAVYAMKDGGGTLKVSLVRKGSPEIKSDENDLIPLEDYICLIVSDTGCGMSKTVLNRIYEPYFTTKPKGEGTGLGLSVVSGIVKDHGGNIYVRTYPGEGTYFRICFPAIEIPAENIKHPKSHIRLISENRKVMVVDDEVQITFMLKYMLEELGLDPETYNCPSAAYEAFRADPDKYSLVITDQSMPGMTGTELSVNMLALKSDLPIILNTGYSPVISRNESLNLGIKEFMMKPITISDLSIIIEKALKKY